MFFTNLGINDHVNPMQFARATNNRMTLISDPLAYTNIKDDYFPGPMHFGDKIEKHEGYKFFDVDLKSAYPTWLINYKKGNFNYHVGGKKRYFDGVSVFRFNTEGMKTYRIRFTVKTTGSEKSKIYRRWFLKTTKVRNMIITDKYISGIINIPDIGNLVNRFLNDLYLYEEHDIKVDSIIVATGMSNVYINEKRIAEAMGIKNNRNHPLRNEYKTMLNASTGYLAIADKLMYFVMVNQIRLELFRLMDAIDRWNIKRPDMYLEIVAANTDGLTIHAKAAAEYALNDIINYNLNPYSVFKFDLKNIYDYELAHQTANDIRMKVN